MWTKQEVTWTITNPSLHGTGLTPPPHGYIQTHSSFKVKYGLLTELVLIICEYPLNKQKTTTKQMELPENDRN